MKLLDAYQLKVFLNEYPAIWRRFLIPGDFTFSDLHMAIQDVMGWHDYHLHEFEMTNPLTRQTEVIGIPDDESVWDNEIVPGQKRRIDEMFSLENATAKYTYDYGDYWIHQIELERILPITKVSRYPVCTDGEGACPPEDCGGITIYRYLLDNLHRNGGIKEQSDEELLYWGPYFRANEFCLQNIYFRERPSERDRLTESDELWIRKLLQGKISLSELKQALGSKMPYHDIETFYKCALNSPLRFRTRAIGILSSYNVIPIDTISKYLFTSVRTLSKNIEVYRDKGVSPVISDKRKRSRRHEDSRYIEKVFAIIHSPPTAYGFNRTTWKQKDIIQVMSDCGMPICLNVLKRIIDASGYKYRKARTVLTSNDPQYKEKLERIKAILSALGPREKFFSIDEYGPFAVKIQGGRSLVPAGMTKIVPQWQKSKGSIIVTAALELSTNQITHFYSQDKNTSEMLKLLDMLLEQYSDQECIYLSWDAAAWHVSKELYRRVDKINSPVFKKDKVLPIVKLAPLPVSAQFLNVIESVFSGMARAIIHNSDYKSQDECKSAIDRYFSERNEYFRKHPKRAGKKIWGKERVKPIFSESNNCKDPLYR
jgi:hypothetical protein